MSAKLATAAIAAIASWVIIEEIFQCLADTREICHEDTNQILKGALNRLERVAGKDGEAAKRFLSSVNAEEVIQD